MFIFHYNKQHSKIKPQDK
uniref:Uncharacterized protein n=1 Tax=Anguilla anguilla TaxID=7936 RepID=A0A0E9V1K5_ANGAN